MVSAIRVIGGVVLIVIGSIVGAAVCLESDTVIGGSVFVGVNATVGESIFVAIDLVIEVAVSVGIYSVVGRDDFSATDDVAWIFIVVRGFNVVKCCFSVAVFALLESVNTVGFSLTIDKEGLCGIWTVVWFCESGVWSVVTGLEYVSGI